MTEGLRSWKENVVKCVPGHGLPLGCVRCKWACEWLNYSHCERTALEVPINLPGTRVQRIGLLKLRI